MKIIPKKFKIYGRTITVEYVDDLLYDDDYHGLANYRKGKIILQTPSKQVPISDETLEATFLHELMHHVLYATSDNREDILFKDEELVERISGVLHQVIQTCEFN